MSSVIQIGSGVTALWGFENGPFLLLWPVAYTTACTTVQAVKNDFTFWIRYGISTNFGMIVLDYPKSEVTQYV